MESKSQSDCAGELRARFHWPRADFTLNVDIRLPARGITVLFGHSGSGKTSLLRALAGLERIGAGELWLGDVCWQSSSLFVPTHRRPLGYVFQEASLFEHLNVAQNLAYGRKRSLGAGQVGATTSDAEYQHILQLLDLEPLLQRWPAQLSGGERQRVAIARALLLKPRLLLMDEPLASLDHARKQEILSYLERLHTELDIPLLYVTHSSDELVRLADHVLLLERGRVLAQGSLSQVLADQRLLAHVSDEPFSLLLGELLPAEREQALLEVRVGAGDNALHLRLPPQARPQSGAAELQQTKEELQPTQQELQCGRGKSLRLRLYARDISISLSRAQDSSILNVLPGRISAIEPSSSPGQSLLHLACGSQTLLARLTNYSCEQLQLRVGLSVFAQIKAVSILP